MLLPNTPRWKLILVAIIIILAIFINYWFMTSARSEDCWILCQPDSWVNARMNPRKKSMELGRLECGEKLETDGVIKNGFIHIIDLHFEMCEGWVSTGYIVFDEPLKSVEIETEVISNGRVAARKTVNGKRRCWVKDGQTVKVYMVSKEWSVTNKGFIKTEFLNIGALWQKTED